MAQTRSGVAFDRVDGPHSSGDVGGFREIYRLVGRKFALRPPLSDRNVSVLDAVSGGRVGAPERAGLAPVGIYSPGGVFSAGPGNRSVLLSQRLGGGSCGYHRGQGAVVGLVQQPDLELPPQRNQRLSMEWIGGGNKRRGIKFVEFHRNDEIMRRFLHLRIGSTSCLPKSDQILLWIVETC